ncbi:MAG TPA: DUF58 domain-containing protein [Acidimicrobiia bacterium]|nr:DUF58 domain-containing protein [Acidimicrobiia bacterium]
MSLTRRGVGLLALAALSALVLPAPVAVGVFVISLVVIGTDAWQVRGLPDVSVVIPPILSRGVDTAFRVTGPPGVQLRMTPSPDIRLSPLDGTGRIEGTVRAIRRGRHRLPGPATLAVGPLGLGCWFHRRPEEIELVVYPDMPAARRIATEVRLGRFGDASRRSRGPLGLGTELESIRDYQPDDDIRQVNWRATARVGTPMSNTYRIDQEREVIVLLDTGRLMAAPVGDGTERTRLDVAVDAAAALAETADVVGDRVGVVAFDDRVRRRLLPRRDGAAAVIEAIHDLEPSPVESDFEVAFRLIAHHKRAFVLILTDLMEETAATPLVEAIPLLGRHHAVAVAGVCDPAVVTALTTPADREEEAYRTAVAVEIETSRRRAATLISAYGADVIDTAPASLPRQAVAAYLQAKRRARL